MNRVAAALCAALTAAPSMATAVATAPPSAARSSSDTPAVPHPSAAVDLAKAHVVDSAGAILSVSIPTEVVLYHASDGATLTARTTPSVVSDGGAPGKLGLQLVTPAKPDATGTYAGVMSLTLDYN